MNLEFCGGEAPHDKAGSGEISLEGTFPSCGQRMLLLVREGGMKQVMLGSQVTCVVEDCSSERSTSGRTAVVHGYKSNNFSVDEQG